jgi:amino-acid N-acetyltransferase
MHAAIANAAPADLPALIELLQTAKLPHQDVTEALLAHFLLVKRGGTLVGAVGLEPLGTVGLLRSLVVAAPHRHSGLGVKLTAALERCARHAGIEQLYLLTTSAESFFARLGYRVIPRADAPPALQGTTEFRELCSSTSVCMVKALD